jgi:adenylosuccinate lyase
MIDRYALPELREIFSERHKLELWLRIELLAVEALRDAGVVPDGRRAARSTWGARTRSSASRSTTSSPSCAR